MSPARGDSLQGITFFETSEIRPLDDIPDVIKNGAKQSGFAILKPSF